MSELAKRILFAVPAAAAFLFITWVGGVYFSVLIIAVALFIQHEMSGVCRKAGFPADRYFIYTFALWILLIPQLPYAFEIGVAIFLMFIAVQVFKQTSSSIRELVATLFGGIYAPLGLMLLLMVRDFGSTDKTGFVLVLSLLLMIWGNDVFAYFGGKSFGKRLMAPNISPKKTWEGFVFGIVGAGAGISIVYLIMPASFPFTAWQTLPMILLISLFGPIGDLIVSKLKRAAGLKDTSHILPGHGGLLDRFDALILATPAFYLYLSTLELLGYATF